ncbi:TPA: FtsX-like permease family protein [Clostridioides difficile]|uniref:ABC-type transport system, permease n=2 Tax=Clostridioides difficile TaxID=1496 RepID=Q187Q8_CLOD6|nr:FtsX-like permease family protein [Clostridioides difficile]EQF65106.1 ftsX-like permease family protein [Clostridioides difficile CD196]AJP11674.1 ABC-type transport system, permease [Clostridioides difficile 630]ARE62858.1 ABC-type transport system, permease [Clostridioides difficile]AXB64754.1 ABC transporter permease [Clostridioides difficile]EGT3676003.1 FtsX-like permease family protein [Clostridioides difficile]
MKIILKYIFTNIKERKIRTAVMLLSIVLSTVLLFVSFSIGLSYESAQRKMAKGMYGTATISVQSKNPDILTNLEDIPDLNAIKSKVGVLESSAIYNKGGYYEEFSLISADLSQLNKINKPRLENGDSITDFSGDKIILPNRFTSKYKIKKGDSITLQIYGKSYTFQVSDIASYDTVFLRNTRGVNALLPKETLSKIINKGSGYTRVLIESEEEMTENLVNKLSEELSTEKYMVSNTINETKIISDARQKTMPFFLISFFALTLSIFIIYSSYKVITLERLPFIGTFRSIGANEKTVTRILMLESILYGSIGGLIAIPIGVVVLNLMLHGLGSSLEQGISIPVVISPIGVIISVIVAIIVSSFSAYIPVKKASHLPIKNIVLGTVEEKNVSNRSILFIGSIMFILSILLPRISPENTLYLAGGFSLLGLIVATIVLIPLITDIMSIVFEFVYKNILGNEGKLAARNMKNNKNIIQNITLLFISISAVIAISVVGNFVKTYITDVFRDAELQGFADGKMNEEFIEDVRHMDGIKKILPLYVMNNEISGNGVTLSRLEGTDNIKLYNSMFGINYTNFEIKKQVIEAFNDKRSVILNEDTLKKVGLSIGDTITLSNDKYDFSYKIVGSFKSRANDVEAVIPSHYAVSDFDKTNYGFLVYTAVNPDAVMIQIRYLFGDTYNWSRTVEEFNNDSLNTISSFLSPMNKMTYFIFLLATVGIINNLLINYIQKRRSIAMYKSIGLSNKQNIKVTLIEGFTSGLLGAVIGIVISILEIQTIFIVAGPKISMKPDLDFKTFIIVGLLGIIVTLIGSIVPIIKGKKMKLIEEIKFE